MKKLIIFSICAITSAGFMYLINCSKPLDINEIDNATSDTLYISDTVTYIDTIYIDTIYIDTIFVDTLFCARLNSHRQEVVWMLFNEEGLYQLNFQALPQRIVHPQILFIEIDGRRFSWVPSNNQEFILETELEQHTLIRITSIPPHAYGQAIDICLSVRVL